ncbi:MAG: recombinase RecA, partial [Pseudomonadota bacterium]
IGQGRENAKQFLRDNPDVAASIEDKIRAGHGLDFGVAPDDGGEDVMEA